MTPAVDLERHRLDDAGYRRRCRAKLDVEGALVLSGFFTAEAVQAVIDESMQNAEAAYYAGSTHNVYLTEPDVDLADDHPFNRQVISSKGLLADDQISTDSSLRAIYDDEAFRAFLCAVLGVDEMYPYNDKLSSINVHLAGEGRELGWHFDNSSFAVTMLLQAPEAGGVFEYVPAVRDADAGDMAFDRVRAVLDGQESVSILEFEPGDLVVFRGRDSLHRVTPTIGARTRLLVVFAFNSQPDVALSESALRTFYGRTG